MAVRVSILGSGSGGNCTVIASSRTRLMIDAGFSRRETLRRLAAAGEDASRIAALVISHEHGDHVAGLRVLARSLKAPVYINDGTRAALGAAGEELERVEKFQAGHRFTIGDIEVLPFTVPHDAADPVAFAFWVEGVKIGLITDLGYLAENVREVARDCACLVIESNHDLDMLKVGPYPWALKQRVLSRVGHLSNDGLAAFLADGFDGAAAHLVLAHLSQNNNLPELARLTAEQALAGRGGQPALHVAAQNEPLAPIVL